MLIKEWMAKINYLNEDFNF
jgi:gas vesicle protein